MKTVREYLRHAEECDSLAAKATSAEQRKMITDMSETWRLLARQREDKLRKQLRKQAATRRTVALLDGGRAKSRGR